MWQTKQIVLFPFLMLSGVLSAIVFNYAFLDKLFIPDPCYYHTHEPGAVIGLFYDFPSSENGHPVPSLFNLLFTVFLGLIPGYLIARVSGNRIK